MKKRLFSLVLCLVMVFSLLPIGSLAAAGDQGVYAVFDGAVPSRATYTFKVDGESVNTQTVQAGETLTEPAAPTPGPNRVFDGWYVGETKLEFDENGILTVDAVDGDVTVDAHFTNVWHVTFMNSDNDKVVSVKSVEKGKSLNLSEIQYNVSSTDGTKSVVGWSKTQGSDTMVADPYTPDADVTLYPVVKSGFWLKFDENDGGASGIAGASYTPAQFLTAGQSPTEPSAPTRMGYTFGGWYTNADCTTPYNFTPISGPTTVFAKWNPGNADYTIIIWKQRVTDDWNASDANKHWDYAASVPLTATVGSSVSVANNPYRQYGDKQNVTINGKTYDFMGFQYYKCDDAKTVAADGSTILNVYYTRRVITITFNPYASNDTVWEGEWVGVIWTYLPHNHTYYVKTNGQESAVENTTTFQGEEYAGKASYKGLYGAELNFTWPTMYYEKDDQFVHDDRWYETGNTLWHYGNTDLSFLGNFILPDKEANDITLTFTKSGSNPIKFYKQSVDGNSWELARTVYMDGGSGFGITDKFEGFTAYKYVITNRNAAYPAESQWSNAKSGNSYRTTEAFSNRDLHIFFQRNSYNIDFQYTTGATARDTVVKKYQAPLNDVSEAAPAYPSFLPADEYEFVGWFADPELTTYVSFQEISDAKKAELQADYGIHSFVSYAGQTMPTNNIVLYAGYFKIGFDCALNPNGGELDKNTQAGVFWAEINSQIDSVISEHVSRDGFSIAGWEISEVDGDLINVHNEGPKNYRYVGDFSNWTSTHEDFAFSTQVKAPIYLTAKWISNAALSVAYDLNGGTGTVTDSNVYLDGADVAVSYVVPTQTGKQFIGWKVEGEDDKILMPGETLELNKANQDLNNNNTIVLTAIYDTAPVATITWHANNGTDAAVTDTPNLNEAIGIRSKDTFTRDGYVFAGWSKTADGDFFLQLKDDEFVALNGGEWQSVTKVATNSKDTGNDLYAVWDKIENYTYVIDFNGRMILAENATEPKTYTAPVNGTFGLDTDSNAYYQLNSGKLLTSTKEAPADLTYTAKAVDTALIFGTHIGDNAASWQQVNVVPASNIYYADSFSSDIAADNQIGYSAGQTATGADKNVQQKLSFTFTGSRIDVYLKTTSSDGTVGAILTKSNGEKVTKMVACNTDSTYASTPAVSFDGLSGQSTLTITGGKNAKITLNGVRVYNEAANDVEQNVQYIKLREMLLGTENASMNATQSGAMFFVTDGTNLNPAAADPNTPADQNSDEFKKYVPQTYENLGPKHEVYLANGQAIAFNVTGTKSVMVGLRAPEGGEVYVSANGEINTTGDGTQLTNLDMYYPISPVNGKYVITNDTNVLVSATNVKLTDVPAGTGLSVSPELLTFMASFVRTAPADTSTTETPETPVTPEAPETPETHPKQVWNDAMSLLNQLFSRIMSALNQLFGGLGNW